MNYSIVLNILLAATVLFGFLARYLAVLTHKTSPKDGRLGLAIASMVILYSGVIFASMDKIAYSSIFKSALILGLVCLALDATLTKLSKYV